jgi:hypothetical protein
MSKSLYLSVWRIYHVMSEKTEVSLFEKICFLILQKFINKYIGPQQPNGKKQQVSVNVQNY